MAAWDTKDDLNSGPGAGATALSASVSGDIPVRTPSKNSKRSSRGSATLPDAVISPARLPDQRGDKRSSRDVSTDETISILDPRRFTPTLHANLVSEILALRRDQEEKTRQIDTLETSLHNAKEEHSKLQENAAIFNKEHRSLKRQMSLLEGGTSSALNELARERDEAVDSASDVKKRLEMAQRKLRTQDEDSQRLRDEWTTKTQGWDDERRKMERRLHVAESRLKLLLDQVAAHEAAQVANIGRDSDDDESLRDNDAGSVRTMSLTNSIRYSLAPTAFKGHSLAEELDFDDDDQTDADGRDSVLSNYPTHRPIYLQGRDGTPDRAHGRIQRRESLRRPASTACVRPFIHEPLPQMLEDSVDDNASSVNKANYADTATQYSPLPSPVLRPIKPALPEAVKGKPCELEPSARGDSEIEANQRRKRVQIAKPLKIETLLTERKMVSAAAQTVEEPLSPPKTPQSTEKDLAGHGQEAPESSLANASTQTDYPQSRSGGRLAPSLLPISIPSIMVQPPTSRPTTPRSPRLPQYSKDFGCQVKMPSEVSLHDAAVQTEGIQIDRRLAQLPTHLQPWAISSRPTSRCLSLGKDKVKISVSTVDGVPARNPKRLTPKASASDFPESPISSTFYDDGQASTETLAGQVPSPSLRVATRRSNRLGSLINGFDSASSDEHEDLSEGEFPTALSAPKMAPSPPRPVKGTYDTEMSFLEPSESIENETPAGPITKSFGTEIYGSFSLKAKEKQNRASTHVKRLSRTYGKPPAPPPPGAFSGGPRKGTTMQNSQGTRARSPSLPDAVNPPFPIPHRESSRKPGTKQSPPSDGNESPTRGCDWYSRGGNRSTSQAHNVRKVRSAAVLSRTHRFRRNGSRSPPPWASDAAAPELPPLPNNDMTTPRNKEGGTGYHKRHGHQLSTNTTNTNNTEPTSQTSSSQTNGVVGAIAQTMVGEWMLKYVRRRRSFGMPESTGRDDSSNDRHKRWVWLAPYERAVLWSSKQPSSGSALLGKTGRKLIIQSVLDVKDDNAAPKVMPSVFNRSILILTPQRALKFTASSAERHYLWLTALSFLAHSSHAVPEVIAPPQLQLQEKRPSLPDFEAPKARSKFKKGGIRDSIRLAKGKANVYKNTLPSVMSVTSAASSHLGDKNFGAADAMPGFSPGHSREQSGEAAEPPLIPRFSERNLRAHGRKRSNTAGYIAPPLSFRGFPGGTGYGAPGSSAANTSVGTRDSFDFGPSQAAAANGTWGTETRRGNFFDAIGTVRMEAFISPLAYSPSDEGVEGFEEIRQTVRRRSKEVRRRESRKRRDYIYQGGRDLPSRGRGFEQDEPVQDLFKGF
ncbi:hypothetical protein CDD82_6141 [Ophiocordyceps australis]|uniref:Pleckstrin homology domain-containing protein n=1 Tax=Ophiocordyceps australis TaxID=1399860 RepID=A0A2C5YX23_9HYPO|nr:hypothetical protein CDD82_6141 [Ophiocordyceps australis]